MDQCNLNTYWVPGRYGEDSYIRERTHGVLYTYSYRYRCNKGFTPVINVRIVLVFPIYSTPCRILPYSVSILLFPWSRCTLMYYSSLSSVCVFLYMSQ